MVISRVPGHVYIFLISFNYYYYYFTVYSLSCRWFKVFCQNEKKFASQQWRDLIPYFPVLTQWLFSSLCYLLLAQLLIVTSDLFCTWCRYYLRFPHFFFYTSLSALVFINTMNKSFIPFVSASDFMTDFPSKKYSALEKTKYFESPWHSFPSESPWLKTQLHFYLHQWPAQP